MSIPTITITGNVLPPNNVAAGGTVTFELNTVAVDLGSGVVVPRKVSTPILSGGAISQAIWPNAAGESPSRYAVYLEMIPSLDGDCPVRIKLGEITLAAAPSTQDLGSLIAAGAAITGGASLVQYQFATRDALVLAIASGVVPIPGFTYFAGGLSYLGKAGATGISDLPGLVPLGDICPDHFPGARFLDAGPMIRAAAAYAASIAPAKVVLQDGAYIVTSVEERTVYVSVSADPGVLTATPHKAAVWLAADVSLIGGGREISTFDCSGITDTFQYGVAFLDYSNGEVSGFKLQGPSATTGSSHATQLSLLSSDTTHVNRNVTVRDLWITDWASYGFGHQYGAPENVTVSDLLIENTGADGVDHKVRFGPGDPFDNAFGVQFSNIIVRNPGRRIDTSVSGMGIRGRAELVNIEVTGVPAGCDGIQMTAGIHQQEETRPAAQRSTLTNFYVEGEDPSAPIVALNCFSSGPMEISNGYIRNGYVLAQAETTSPYGFQDGPSIQGVTVEGCRGGNAFHVLADRTHLIGCRSLSEKAYFDAKRGNLVAGQTELTPPDGISVTPVVVKNGAILTVTTDYTVTGNTVTLSVAALVSDKFIVVQPTARPARIEGLHCQMIGGGGDEYHTTTTGIIPTTAVQNSIVSLGWRDERFPTVGVRPANATPILVPITSGDSADLRIFAKGTGVSSLSGGNGTRQVLVNDNGVGFYNTSPIVKPTASGSTANGAAVKSLSAALAALGLVTDSTTVASENMTTRAALVAANTATPGLGLSDGQVVFAAGLGYMRQAAATDIPDLLGFVPAGTRTPFHFGWVGDGTEADQKRGNLALTFPGKTVIDRPGTYFFGNSNPIADSFPTGDEDECDWWAMRRAWYIGRDDVVFEIGAGVNFIAASGSDCHFIQIGQPEITVRNGAGADIGTTTHVDCDNVQVIGARPDVDMNGDNQTAATADDYHFAGVWIQDGSTNIRVTGLSLRDGNYYGIGGEGNFASAGFSDIYIGDNDITNFPADGIDFKDFGSDSNGIVIENNRLALVAYSESFGSSQAAIDVRNGAEVYRNIIDFTDAFAGNREAIRVQSASAGVESDSPSQVIGNLILGNGGAGVTRGIRAIAANVTTARNEIRDMHTGIWVTSPFFSSSQDHATDCAAQGLRLDADAGAGWAADNADINGFTARNCLVGIRFADCDRASLTNCHVVVGGTGWQIDATATATRIIGGMNTATTRLTRAGSGSLIISDVNGYTTEAAVTASIPINTTGVKTVTVAHGLPFTPALSEVQVTLQQGSAVSDFVLGFPPMVSAVDATNVTVVTNVTTASASGSSVLARVIVSGFQR